MKLDKYLPAIEWLKTYQKSDFQADFVASIIVTIMLIPQSLAYAMLAGLSPEVGLYASILPLVAYSLFGSSRTLAVGPVAVVSMMTGAATLEFAAPGTQEYTTIVILLAGMSGLFLLGLGILRLGFLANLLSHPVISGFISASAIIIAVGQVKHLIGINASGHNLPELLNALANNLNEINTSTTVLGFSSIIALLISRRYLPYALRKLGTSETVAQLTGKAAPVFVVSFATIAVIWFDLLDQGVSVVGHVPEGLPALSIPTWDASLVKDLLPSVILISIVGFVESVSVAQSFAAKRRQSINPDQELIGLGAANIGSSISAGFPVTGGFSRSVVSFDAGARTPMTGIFTAVLILLTLSYLTGIFYYLPNAVLAATIIVSVLQLIDVQMFKSVWRYSKRDAVAMIGTFLVVLLGSVEAGIMTGVGLSILLFLWHTSHPHIAVVGKVPGTEHFRNVERFKVETHPSIVTVRIDENLFFANARVLEDRINSIVANQCDIKHVVLMCTAVNMIDSSALESIEMIDSRLQSAGIQLHLSEVKGPVMDRLKETHFLKHLSGGVFLTQHQAVQNLLR